MFRCSLAAVLSLAFVGFASAQEPPKSTPQAAPTLAELAAESNQYFPCCERFEPGKWLWGCDLRCRSWQERYMSCRGAISDAWNAAFSQPAFSDGQQHYHPLARFLPW